MPVGDDELGALFDPLFRTADGQPRRLTLALSGGPDSTALVWLAARWCAAGAIPTGCFDVAVVDHRLRPGSAEEAEAAAAWAQRLGFAATVLVWDRPVRIGLQEAARTARRRLLVAHVTAREGVGFATGHTADDQAETLLMRLARGSGVDGLSAMHPETHVGKLALVRPLLGVTKARLIATLEAAGVTWAEDPSNSSIAFERVRFRAATRVLADLGLTPEALGQSARRLQRARRALDAEAARYLSDARLVAFSPAGYARLNTRTLAEAPEEIRLRVMSRLLQRVGGGPLTMPMMRVEALTAAAFQPDFRGRTLAACVIAPARNGQLLVAREAGRRRPLPMPLAPGQSLVFDGRFTLELAPWAPAGLTVASAGMAGARLARDKSLARPEDPAAALRTMPALTRDGTVVALPALGDPAAADVGCRCQFGVPEDTPQRGDEQE